jgi:hypothetical protein
MTERPFSEGFSVIPGRLSHFVRWCAGSMDFRYPHGAQ